MSVTTTNAPFAGDAGIPFPFQPRAGIAYPVSTVQPRAVSLTDRSGVIEVAASAQQVMAANPDRVALLFQNTSDEPMRLRFGATASATAGYIIDPGEALVFVSVVPTDSVSVYCAQDGKGFEASEA